MPCGTDSDAAGTKPDCAEEQRNTRDDPHKGLGEAIGFIFEGLTKEEIKDRLAFYSLPGIPNPSIEIDEILADTRPPLPAEEKAFRLVVPMLQGMLRAECKRQERKSGKGNREVIADLADSIVEKLLDSSRGGKTWGEQHARLLHREPFALSDACSLANDSPLTVKQANDRLQPLREFQVVREIEDLKLEFKKILPSKSEKEKSEREQQRKRDELFKELKKSYPELGKALQSSLGIKDLTPDRAARIVWGHRQTPVIAEKTVSNLLGDMNDRILWRTNKSQWIKNHPEIFETSTTKERS